MQLCFFFHAETSSSTPVLVPFSPISSTLVPSYSTPSLVQSSLFYSTPTLAPSYLAPSSHLVLSSHLVSSSIPNYVSSSSTYSTLSLVLLSSTPAFSFSQSSSMTFTCPIFFITYHIFTCLHIFHTVTCFVIFYTITCFSFPNIFHFPIFFYLLAHISNFITSSSLYHLFPIPNCLFRLYLQVFQYDISLLFVFSKISTGLMGLTSSHPQSLFSYLLHHHIAMLPHTCSIIIITFTILARGSEDVLFLALLVVHYSVLFSCASMRTPVTQAS